MTAAAKAYKGMGMEGGVARWYDRTTRKSMADFQRLAAQIAAMIPAGAQVLEIAPGPGFLSIEMAKRGLDVQAVEISKTFVEIARKNAAEAGVTAVFMEGDAAELPVWSGSVDFVVCRAAFKNFTEPVKSMREMLRVLRPGGTAVLIDLRKDVPMEEIRRYVKSTGVSRLNRLFMNFTFKHMLIKRAYRLEEIRRMAAEAGWKDVRIEAEPMGFAAWVKRP
jgi:ubiquinone/menaquinone biosynthesis C-methylase UbiE